jgi:hypothetical protein
MALRSFGRLRRAPPQRFSFSAIDSTLGDSVESMDVWGRVVECREDSTHSRSRLAYQRRVDSAVPMANSGNSWKNFHREFTALPVTAYGVLEPL